MNLRIYRPLALLCLLAPGLAGATVVASGAGGFVLHTEVVYPGGVDAAWQRLVQPALWWSADHTYSGSAAHLTLTLQPGGCWCEALAEGGWVRHMDVLFVSPGKRLRLAGGLGPLQGIGASGALTFTLKADANGTTRILTDYTVSGFAAGGFEALAAGVDKVLTEQLQRLGTP